MAGEMRGENLYREVLLQIERNSCQEVEIDTGSLPNVTIKTDGHIKSGAGGGFSYKDTARVESFGKNRFIHWKTSKNVLELSEESLDVNLLGNFLKIHFQNASLLPHAEIFETSSSVVVLAATTNSVHRFIFPHPSRLQRHDFSLSPRVTISIQSIFSDCNIPDVYSPWNFAMFPHSCSSFSAWLCHDGHCLFNLITNEGTTLLVKLPPVNGEETVEHYELKNAGVMQRLWSGLVPSRIRGDGVASDGVISAQINPISKETYIFTLCQDYKIRVWSCQTQECVSVKNLLDDIPDDVDLQNVTGQSHMLRKAINSTAQRIYLGVFLSLSQNVQFAIYEVVYLDGKITLILVTNFFSPKGNLIDFVVSTKQIWTLWMSDDGVPFVQYTLIESSQLSPTGWQNVFLDNTLPNEIFILENQEPREAYLDYIFHPGRFSKCTIDKAIKIFDTSPRRPLTTVRKTHLKEQVTALVDAQVQNSANTNELGFQEFSDLQLQMWSRFYACVVQYHEAANKPLGLFVNMVGDLVAVIRKEAISILRPCDDVTTLYWNPVSEEALTSLADSLSVEDHADRNDVQYLLKCVNLVNQRLSQDHVTLVDGELKCGHDAISITQDIAGVLVIEQDQRSDGKDRQFLMDVEMNLQKVQSLVKTVENVLNMLDISQDLEDDDIEELGGDIRTQHLNLRRLFASDLSVRILASALGQQCQTRMSLCRDLLILMQIIARISARAGLVSLGSYTISSEHVPRASYLLRIYYSLHWLSTQSVLPTPPNALDSNLKQLAALEITDTSNVETLVVPESTSCTVLELFLSGKGGHQMRLLLPKNMKDTEGMNRGSFKTAMVNALDALRLLLWPNRTSVFVSEYLVTKGQFQTLLEYCFVLGAWCIGGQASRAFLQGQAHLVFGDYSKALDCFVYAVQNLDEKEPLFNKLLFYECEDERQSVQCYVKVMRLFEQFGASEFVLKAADAALSVAEEHDESLPIIWSNIFKHHLELGHNDEAYAAITSNPDIERKRDCLHRFVVVLCERGERLELVEYPYVNLLEEVVSIIEYHARTVDISTHSYYQLLYAFHTYRGNHRKAASAMYEYGIRLSQELPGLQSLQKQAKCYLTTMNSLRLLEPKNSWIVKPLDRKEQKEIEAPNMSPKRKQGDEDGEEAYTTMIPRRRRRVTVLEIKDLEKEYMLVLARLQLLQQDTDPAHVTGPSLSPDETLVLLVQAGQYDTAFSIAKAFDLPLTSIFDGLAARCVKLSLYTAPNTDLDERMSWLKSNDTNVSGLTRDSSPADQAWNLLNVYLDRFGSKQNCVYYKCVCTRLLSMGCVLPTWLVNAYKVANPAELLQLLINFDLLQEAGSLALEYLNAVMGHGKEYFGIEETLAGCSSPVWFPYVALDQLLAALDKVDGDESLCQLKDVLKTKLDDYLNTVSHVSQDMIDLRWRQDRTRVMQGVH
ncbi:nuclear pore complex protein Nup160-like [Dendronephthya gigantea]|uniref:nuclear pore complex protein Nup160-like n=1 Tax=Dendronephthya gigantea TaxID=151771 RepID=UPI0010697F80|nr:nuclear pore complex protein Nup160-like [Dendronephthya gigantea]XP_028408933.1 nuclear pore complex protein Nup160-like [Dendronephthya gigantea]